MSSTPRIFLSSVPPGKAEITLDEATSRYLVKVMRLTEGARFSGFDAEGVRYQLELSKANVADSTVTILSKDESQKGVPKTSITLAQGLPKAAKMDLILRQGTEVGVDRFIPLVTQRSVSRPDPSQYGHKNDRWQKILVEASRQCGRGQMPQLDPVTAWESGLDLFQGFDQVLLPYEKQAPTLRTVLESKPDAGKILVLIGPEGGWAPEEVKIAQEKGASPVHLPTPILRTETAGIAVVSMIRFFKSGPEGERS